MARVRQQRQRVALVSPKGVRVTVGLDVADKYLKRGYRRPTVRRRAPAQATASK